MSNAQLQAFQRNDAITIFSLSCPELQRQLRYSRAFMEMIKINYQPIYSPRFFATPRHF
ncbi:DUF4864 domain-containing protein [Leptothoe spongobia]|uniref:DUF4864 domain-containing protein n=1 Tax=Leptothoe spongobia TAU-MAC 1115 TaxID=1967444 RepID=A0A947DG99_9CYAN|nr:DUF4864 domain-containing protein [Leptothoe spongobia TAU-MAC 1115]